MPKVEKPRQAVKYRVVLNAPGTVQVMKLVDGQPELTGPGASKDKPVYYPTLLLGGKEYEFRLSNNANLGPAMAKGWEKLEKLAEAHPEEAEIASSAKAGVEGMTIMVRGVKR